MKLTSFVPHGEPGVTQAPAWRSKPQVGVVSAAGILDVAAAARERGDGRLDVDAATFYRDADLLMQPLRELAADAQGPYLSGNDAASHAPVVPRPSKILCAGLNYRKHAEESGAAVPTEPILFSKFENTLVGTGATVDLAGLDRVDYEAELAVVVGTAARHVSEERALDHVLGYANANDLSERALQMRTGQWLIGKTPDGFLPLGPYLVTPDEVGDPQDLRIRGWLDDDLRQDSSTGDMIFSVAELIAYASRYMTLWPGDVILTGTPEGVILGRSPQDWVQPGQRFDVEIAGLGRLTTRFA